MAQALRIPPMSGGLITVIIRGWALILFLQGPRALGLFAKLSLANDKLLSIFLPGKVSSRWMPDSSTSDSVSLCLASVHGCCSPLSSDPAGWTWRAGTYPERLRETAPLVPPSCWSCLQSKSGDVSVVSFFSDSPTKQSAGEKCIYIFI